MPPETTAGNSVYVRGLPCELAVIDAFDEARATVLHRQDVRDYLARHGQMKSTIARTVPRMVKSGNLEYRREWLAKEMNTWRKPLDAVRIFEALQVGLFPETFHDDEEVKRELDEHYEAMMRERAELIARTNAENAERIADGEKAIPLPTGRFETPRDALKGLVIKSGGQRVGLVRLAAYVAAIGAKGGAAEVDGARSGAA